MHVFAFEKMPCIDAYIPARSVKGWFLSPSVAAQFEDERGCKLSLQELPYLDELILVCDNMERGYWSSEETDCLLIGIRDYWDILKTKMSLSLIESVARDEYNYRAQRMLQCMAAVVRNAGTVSSECGEKLQRMIACFCLRMCYIRIRKMDYLLRMFCICARHVFQSHFKCSS